MWSQSSTAPVNIFQTSSKLIIAEPVEATAFSKDSLRGMDGQFLLVATNLKQWIELVALEQITRNLRWEG